MSFGMIIYAILLLLWALFGNTEIVLLLSGGLFAVQKEHPSQIFLLNNILPVSPKAIALKRIKSIAPIVVIFQIICLNSLYVFPSESNDYSLINNSYGGLLLVLLGWYGFFFFGSFSKSRGYVGYKFLAVVGALPFIAWNDWMSGGLTQFLFVCYLSGLFSYMVWLFIRADYVYLDDVSIERSEQDNDEDAHFGEPIPERPPWSVTTPYESPPKKPGTGKRWRPRAAYAERSNERQPLAQERPRTTETCKHFHPVRSLVQGDMRQLAKISTLVCFLAVGFVGGQTATNFSMVGAFCLLYVIMGVGCCPLVFLVYRYKIQQHYALSLPVSPTHQVKAWLMTLYGYLGLLFLAVLIGQMVVSGTLRPLPFLVLIPTIISQLFIGRVYKLKHAMMRDPRWVFGYVYFGLLCAFLLLTRVEALVDINFSILAEIGGPIIGSIYVVITVLLAGWYTSRFYRERLV